MKILLTVVAMLMALNVMAGEVKSNGRTVLSRALKGHRVQVIIKTSKVDLNLPVIRPEEPLNSCTYSRFPCSVVQFLGVIVDGRKIFVPRSVFSDISDLQSAALSLTSNGQYVLTMKGGDASEGFEVKVNFNSDRVLTRFLYSENEKNSPLQKTEYRNLEID